MKRPLLACLAVLFLSSGAILAALGTPAPAPPKMEFETYQLALLRAVPGAKELPKEERHALLAQHLGHFRKMALEGKMVVAGPFGDQDDKTLEGLCLYRTGSVAEARALAEADPAVKAGRLRVEMMTWYTEKGALAFPGVEKMREARGPAAK